MVVQDMARKLPGAGINAMQMQKVLCTGVAQIDFASMYPRTDMDTYWVSDKNNSCCQLP